MRVYKHWLDHDVAALAFLIVGMTTVELLAMIIWSLPNLPFRNPVGGHHDHPARDLLRWYS